MEYDSIYSIRKAWLEAIGGDTTPPLDSVYTISLRILQRYQSMPPTPPPTPTAETQYLLFTNNDTDQTRNILINFVDYGVNGYNPNLEYSYNREDWTTVEPTETGTFSYLLPFTSTNKIYLRGNNGLQLNKATETKQTKFKTEHTTDNITVSGNILALLDKGEGTQNKVGSYCFTKLFFNSRFYFENLIMDAESINAYGCWNMFAECSNLTTALELKASIIGSYAYNSMYKSCTSLTTAPLITVGSYMALSMGNLLEMFDGCTNLKYVRYDSSSQPTTTSTRNKNWLRGVAESGTFVVNNDVTWIDTIERGTSTVPESWTIRKATAHNFVPFRTEVEALGVVTVGLRDTTTYTDVYHPNWRYGEDDYGAYICNYDEDGNVVGDIVDLGITVEDVDFKYRLKYNVMGEDGGDGGQLFGFHPDYNDHDYDLRFFYYSCLAFDFGSTYTRIGAAAAPYVNRYMDVEIGNFYVKDNISGATICEDTYDPNFLDGAADRHLYIGTNQGGKIKIYGLEAIGD